MLLIEPRLVVDVPTSYNWSCCHLTRAVNTMQPEVILYTVRWIPPSTIINHMEVHTDLNCCWLNLHVCWLNLRLRCFFFFLITMKYHQSPCTPAPSWSRQHSQRLPETCLSQLSKIPVSQLETTKKPSYLRCNPKIQKSRCHQRRSRRCWHSSTIALQSLGCKTASGDFLGACYSWIFRDGISGYNGVICSIYPLVI